MGRQIIGPQFKWCGNCVYWCGERKIDGGLHQIEIDDSKSHGPCSKFLGWTNCSYLTTCPNFTKHPAIR